MEETHADVGLNHGSSIRIPQQDPLVLATTERILASSVVGDCMYWSDMGLYDQAALVCANTKTKKTELLFPTCSGGDLGLIGNGIMR